MLQQAILQSASPMTLDIASADPNEVLILTSISGLSPADLTLFTGDFARTGGYYQGRRVTKRNPVFNFKLNPDYVNDIDVSDVREGLYSVFLEPQALTDGLQVTLKDNKKPDRYFIGYTETFPADIFTDKPTAQISMLCVDPYLRSVTPVLVNIPAGVVSTPFDYEGSADTGFQATIKVATAGTQVVLDLNGQTMVLNKPTNFAVNDLITINTLEGSRSIKLNGVDVMAYLSGASKWLQLTKKANVLKAYGTASGDGKAVITSYGYRAAWWGV